MAETSGHPTGIRNRALFEALGAFTRRAIKALKDLRSREPAHRRLSHVTIFNDDGSLSHGVEERPEWGLHNLDEALKMTEEWGVAEQTLRQDEMARRHLDTLVGTVNSRMRIDVAAVFRSIIAALVDGLDTPVFDEVRFKRLYAEIEDYFYSDLLHFRCLAILRNFEAAYDVIDLDNSLVVKRLDASERSELFSGYVMPFGVGGLGRWDLAFHPFAIECSIATPKLFGELKGLTDAAGPGELTRHTFGTALSAFRLFKVGGVGYEWIQLAPVSWAPFGGIQFTMGHEGEVDTGGKYSLEEREIPAFVRFWRIYRDSVVKDQRRMDLAIRRFNFAYGRFRPEDRLIDYSVSLESLLLRGDEQQELRYRLALRGAALLGRNPEDREAVFRLLSEAYSQRSRIVHGGDAETTIDLGGEVLNSHQFADRVAEYLRSAITTLVSAGEDVSQLPQRLDKALIRGEFQRGA